MTEERRKHVLSEDRRRMVTFQPILLSEGKPTVEDGVKAFEGEIVATTFSLDIAERWLDGEYEVPADDELPE
jgi:hypothetical protein